MANIESPSLLGRRGFLFFVFIMGNEIISPIQISTANILGLRHPQWLLLDYLTKCFNEKKPVEIHEVSVIYFTHCKKERKVFSHWEGTYAFYKRVSSIEYYSTSSEINKKYLDAETKQWLKVSIGSFVLRNLLTVIPKFKVGDFNDLNN